MEQTFKDSVKSISYRIISRHAYLKPIMLIFLFVSLTGYNFYQFIKNNNKRLVTVFIAAIFFFINTSFSGIDDTDEEIYLATIDSVFDDEYLETEITVDNSISSITVIEDDEIVSTDGLSDEIIKDLQNVDVNSSFTLDDFINMLNVDESINTTDEPLSGFDKDAWYLILVNKTHPVPDDYEMELATIKGSMQCDARVLDVLMNMLNGAQKEGVNLIVCSPYRDYELQKLLFDKKVNAYIASGYSYMDAYKLASQKVIVPGASEHQLGLAFDIVTDYHAVLDFAFGDTTAGQWLKRNCAKYGFILRYPRGRESITGIEYEPWHFRYVGVEAATYIMENDLTLEEFIEGL